MFVRNPFITLFILILMKYCCPTAADITNCGTISFKEHVQGVTFFRRRIEALPSTDKLSVRYNIRLRQKPCCALVRFESNRTLNELHGDSNRQCYIKGIEKIVLTSQYYIYLDHRNPTSGCKKRGSDYICSGTRKFHIGNTCTWYISAGYECRVQQPLDIFIEMDISCDVQTKCESLSDHYCQREFNYTQTTFPNTLGQLSKRRADYFLQTLLLVINETLDCYQYSKEFICFSLFPPCNKGKRLLPCMKTCQDIKIACAQLLMKYNQPLYCGIYPDSLDPEVCYYGRVTCPEPKIPEFGYVTYNGTHALHISKYTCIQGYDLEGQQQRMCMYNGRWNGIEPICKPKHIIDIKIMIIVSASVALSMIITLVCVYYKREVSLILMHGRLKSKPIYEVARAKERIFLTYSSEDQDLVQNTFLPTMKFELPAWNILTYQENFVGGEKLLDSIHKGIWESTAVVALLTKQYIDSCWCRYEFTQGQSRSITDKGFKFLVIIPQEMVDQVSLRAFLDGMPENIRAWVKDRIFLRVGEKLFWNKLRRGLASKM